MDTTIHTYIKDSIKEAMKARNIVRLDTLRGLLAMFTNESVSTGKTPQDLLTDDQATVVIKRAIKQRQDSIEQFRNGGREDLAEKEEAELAVLTPLLPEQMSDEDIKTVAEKLKEEHGIDKPKMGILIGLTKKETGGKADGQAIKRVVESLFTE